MVLHDPFLISSRLLPAVKIGDVTISLNCIGSGEYGKPQWRWFIDSPDFEETGTDFYCHGNTQDAMISLLGFLCAAGEAFNYGDNEFDLFPKNICAWAGEKIELIGLLQCDLEEDGDLIED